MKNLAHALLLPVLLSACVGASEGVDETGGVVDDVTVRAGGFFTVSRDMRRCASPMCGGYFVAPVNASAARCADGTTAPRCYVASLDLAPLALSQTQRDAVAEGFGAHVFYGRINAVSAHAYGVFSATEAWRSVDGALPTQSVSRVSTTGTTCTFIPCDRLAMQRVNGTASSLPILGVDAAALRISPELRDDVLGAATRDAGVLVAGVRSTMPGNPSTVRVPFLRASQAFLRVTADDEARHCGASLQTTLATATERLLFTSESDAPFTWFTRDTWRTIPSDATLRRAVGAAADAPVERITLDFLLRNAVQNYDGTLDQEHRAARFRQLSRTLQRELTNITVFRVGTIQIRVFILGVTRCGTVAGLETLSVET
jgi:Nuclease A inhibitor-like protein